MYVQSTYDLLRKVQVQNSMIDLIQIGTDYRISRIPLAFPKQVSKPGVSEEEQLPRRYYV